MTKRSPAVRRVRRSFAGVVLLVALVLPAGTAFAQPRAITGTFSFEDQFTVQPGETAGCSFPIFLDLQVHGSFQFLLDASGEPTRLIVHEIWSGMVSANGNYVIEHAAQTNITDLVSGDSTNVGAIHDQVPFGGVVIHDVGILRFDAAGNLTLRPDNTRASAATQRRLPGSAPPWRNSSGRSDLLLAKPDRPRSLPAKAENGAGRGRFGIPWVSARDRSRLL
jgi:hypothetical protein